MFSGVQVFRVDDFGKVKGVTGDGAHNLTKISGVVKHGHLSEGGPKKAKIQHGVKPGG